MVHGGPGSGCSTRMRDAVDLTRHRLILFDQRGCGRSLPHASDPTTSMDANTTDHLIDDMERLREHLGVQRWLLTGGSWGSTLILAYAQRHLDRVSGVVISGVTTTRRAEINWLYRGAGRFFPAEQRHFRAHVPEATDELFGDDGVLAAYARRCTSPDPDTREQAVTHWCAWEDALIAHESQGRPGAYGNRPPRDRLALVRICAHYFSHAAWLSEGQLLREAPRLAGIPAVLIHGRLDLSGPLDTAWRLAQAWPGAELVVIEDSGHTGSPSMRDQLQRAHRSVADQAAQ
jgi:proline iminopeptidase